MRKDVGEYWDKLQKGTKIGTLKVDWDKWKDEDEVDEKVRRPHKNQFALLFLRNSVTCFHAP
jgi:hypothetical protein